MRLMTRMLATSSNVICLNKREFKTRLMTWRSLSISPYHEGAAAVPHECVEEEAVMVHERQAVVQEGH